MTGIRNASESLASTGILNFDSNAFVMGTKPEFIGSPEPKLNLPFDEPLPGRACCPGFGYGPSVKLQAQPNADAFISKGHGKSDAGLKGGILAAALGAIGLGGLLAWSKHHKEIKAEAKAAEKEVKVAAKAAKKAAKKGVETVKDAVEDGEIMTKVKNGWETVVSKVRNFKVPGWAKVALGVTAAATVLGGLYKAMTSPKQEHAQLPEGPPKFPGH